MKYLSTIQSKKVASPLLPIHVTVNVVRWARSLGALGSVIPELAHTMKNMEKKGFLTHDLNRVNQAFYSSTMLTCQ
eukprot:5625178-Ditylum_brightwellii.AAC.1